MVDQPTIQGGSIQWFKQLGKPLVAMKELLDDYAVQAICVKTPEKLKGWLAGSLDGEMARYENATKHNITYVNVDYPDPYANQSETIPVRNNTNDTEQPSQSLRRNKKRLLIQRMNSKSKKLKKNKLSRSKDWWNVISLSLPLVPFHVINFKITLDKIMRGFLYVQYIDFIDCIAKSIDTGKAINDNIVGYRSLMTHLKTGLAGFSQVFSLLLCNWTRFLDFVTTLEAGNKEKNVKKKFFLYGQAMAKFLVSIATGTNLVTKPNDFSKK